MMDASANSMNAVGNGRFNGRRSGPLSMKGASIYDLDQNPVCVRKWTELENVRTYYEFFKRHEKKF